MFPQKLTSPCITDVYAEEINGVMTCDMCSNFLPLLPISTIELEKVKITSQSDTIDASSQYQKMVFPSSSSTNDWTVLCYGHLSCRVVSDGERLAEP